MRSKWGWSASVAVLAAQPVLAGDLTVEFVGVPADEGFVTASLFDSEDAFLSEPIATASTEETLIVRFADVTPGTYAIAAYHDRDGNGELNTGFFGIPTEPVGASNNPRARFGPPRYQDAAFAMGEEDMTLQINLGDAQ